MCRCTHSRSIGAKGRETLGVKVISAWGMTECGAVTLTRPEDKDERSFNTDGIALPGVEIKIVDKKGRVKLLMKPAV